MGEKRTRRGCYSPGMDLGSPTAPATAILTPEHPANDPIGRYEAARDVFDLLEPPGRDAA